MVRRVVGDGTEGGREEGRKGGREEGREGGRKGGREGGREEGREGGREGREPIRTHSRLLSHTGGGAHLWTFLPEACVAAELTARAHKCALEKELAALESAFELHVGVYDELREEVQTRVDENWERVAAAQGSGASTAVRSLPHPPPPVSHHHPIPTPSNPCTHSLSTSRRSRKPSRCYRKTLR